MTRRNILVLTASAGVLIIAITWAILYQRHINIVETDREDILAYNDSVEGLDRMRQHLQDSLDRASERDDIRNRIAASDFILRGTRQAEQYDPDLDTTFMVSVPAAVSNNNFTDNLKRKGFRLINSRNSREKGTDDAYYNTRYEFYQRFYKDYGYVMIISKEGHDPYVSVVFPSASEANTFAEQCRQLGYGSVERIDDKEIRIITGKGNQ